MNIVKAACSTVMGLIILQRETWLNPFTSLLSPLHGLDNVPNHRRQTQRCSMDFVWAAWKLEMEKDHIQMTELWCTLPGKRKSPWNRTMMDELAAMNLHWGEAQHLAKDKGQWMGLAVAVCPRGDKDYVWTGEAMDCTTNRASDGWPVLTAELQPPSCPTMQCSNTVGATQQYNSKFKEFYFKFFNISVRCWSTQF